MARHHSYKLLVGHCPICDDTATYGAIVREPGALCLRCHGAPLDKFITHDLPPLPRDSHPVQAIDMITDRDWKHDIQ